MDIEIKLAFIEREIQEIKTRLDKIEAIYKVYIQNTQQAPKIRQDKNGNLVR